MKRAANKTIWTEFKAIEFYFESNKCHNLGFFKFYEPTATGGGFLIFEWTLTNNVPSERYGCGLGTCR
jgi:hypothetical protein